MASVRLQSPRVRAVRERYIRSLKGKEEITPGHVRRSRIESAGGENKRVLSVVFVRRARPDTDLLRPSTNVLMIDGNADRDGLRRPNVGWLGHAGCCVSWHRDRSGADAI